MKNLSLLITILFTFSFCESEKRNPDSLQVGMTKSEIHQLLSKPDLVDTIIKNTEIIWGAEEGFWDELRLLRSSFRGHCRENVQ